MRRPRCVRASLMIVAAGWVGSAGCIQNYYPMPVAGPGGVVTYGSVCDVPSAGCGPVAAPGGSKTTVIGGQPPRVVVSQPNSGWSWRRSDPESSLATTRVEGNIDEPTLTK